MKRFLETLARVNLVWLTLVMIVIATIMIATLPPPNVLVSASLESESADIRILNPDEMTLLIPRGVVDDGTPACRENITLRVAKGGRLAISRPSGGAFHVATSGPTQWSTDDGATGSAEAGAYLTVASDGDCAWTGLLRLPLVGEMSVGMLASGSATGDEFLPLTAGDLTVYGRGVDRVFGLPIHVVFFFLPVEPEKLYVASGFPVPPGSQIEGGNARFWGYMQADIGGGGGIHIEASTNAGELSLLAPAPKVSADPSSERAAALEPDRVSLTLGARLAGDPNLHLIFGALSGLAAVMGFAVGLLKLLPRRDAAGKAGNEARATAANFIAPS